MLFFALKPQKVKRPLFKNSKHCYFIANIKYPFKENAFIDCKTGVDVVFLDSDRNLQTTRKVRIRDVHDE